jgi:molybdopterin-synthase adenylyltransferase
MREELVRQSFLGVDSDKVLAAAHVGIVGLGGGGSHVAQQLGHVGIGSLTLFDRDRAEASNLNRLIGATRPDVDVGALKVDVAARGIRSVNPAARVRPIPGALAGPRPPAARVRRDRGLRGFLQRAVAA